MIFTHFFPTKNINSFSILNMPKLHSIKASHAECDAFILTNTILIYNSNEWFVVLLMKGVFHLLPNTLYRSHYQY